MVHKYLGLAFAVVLVAGCANRPVSVVEDFYEAVEDGQQDQAISKLSPELVGMIGDSKMRAVLTKQTQEIAACGGIARITTDLKGDDVVQQGTVNITFKGSCEPKSDKVKLVKVNGEWKISADK
jgi:hypothetical protein